ncbi:lytic transglycosylase domain-containing protein [Rickettsia endosymbiont of Cardiosporidium cionae]|uniref:lytic transglycosylase domain-containing protein n=1 Tax=Rickettsia endosymbiont of Cardiosporidium cionae TaxID=2777155 RepID=UPI0018933225|nr:lytic transglycosylase domain-containing protein [Rickettsia endosymbiont of Cardiosporidium cionae]KAF8818787.1 lytic transglycosylase [Rickettsia endosymbiont of Cardiosporidium cionae]
MWCQTIDLYFIIVYIINIISVVYFFVYSVFGYILNISIIYADVNKSVAHNSYSSNKILEKFSVKLSKSEKQIICDILSYLSQKKWKESSDLLKKIDNPIIKKIFISQKFLLEDSSNVKFEDIIYFIKNNRYWVHKRELRSKAEESIDHNTDKKAVFSWFQKNPPLTANGHKFYAFIANDLISDIAFLIPIIKKAWIYGNFSSQENIVFYNKFKRYLSQADHLKKLDNYLWNKDIKNAYGILPLVHHGYKNSLDIYVKISQKQEIVSKLLSKVNTRFMLPSIVHQYLHSKKYDLLSTNEITQLLNIVNKNKINSSLFWRIQEYFAREYLAKHNFSAAYKIANINQLYSNNKLCAANSEFLSGWIALRFLNKPKLAIYHFSRLIQITETPISRSRGFYWLARAYAKIGNINEAKRLYYLASRYYYTFYGQVALSELNKNYFQLNYVSLILKKDINSKHMSDICQAISIISQCDKSFELTVSYIQQAFYHIAKSAHDIKAIAHTLRASNNTYYKTVLGRLALRKNILIKDYTYPVKYKLDYLPVERALVYGIIRQESNFNEKALGFTNDFGIMQIIPSTAQEVANSLELGFSIERLQNDVMYNINIGSTYIKKQVVQYGGSYVLAIASYNAGAGNVNKWIKLNGDPRFVQDPHEVLDWIELIPFSSTRNYVQRVIENIQVYRIILNQRNKGSFVQNLLLSS